MPSHNLAIVLLAALVGCGGGSGQMTGDDVDASTSSDSAPADAVASSTCEPGTSVCATGCCAWSGETIGTGVRWHAGLRVAGDRVHAAYLEMTSTATGTTYKVKHAVRGAPAWTLDDAAYAASQNTANPRYALRGIALALDASGAPQIGYLRDEIYQVGTRNVQFLVAERTSSAFSSTKIVEFQNTYGSGLAEPLSLDVDGSGRLHASVASCCTASQYLNRVRYGVRSAAGIWSIEDVAQLQVEGAVLAVSPNGMPQIISMTQGEAIDHNTTPGAWQTTEIARDIASQPYVHARAAAIALSTTGEPHVCYQSKTNHLMYTTRSGGTWSSVEVDAAPETGEHCAIALDSAGRPLICYRDGVASDLKCASVYAGQWTTATVVSAGDVGQGVEVAFDGGDRAHVIYFDATQTMWKYLH